jgi:hypothetical protein
MSSVGKRESHWRAEGGEGGGGQRSHCKSSDWRMEEQAMVVKAMCGHSMQRQRGVA